MAVLEQSMAPVTESGWYPDPDSKHHLRYYDGMSWTEHVTHHGPSPCSGCGQVATGVPRS